MKKSGTFTYLGSDDKTIREHTYTYDDTWLMGSTDECNYDLLRFASCVSYAASLKKDILNLFDQLDYEYTASIDYQEKGMNVLAGDKITDSVYYPAPEVNGKYYLNSIGYAIGYKEYEGINLVMVAIRGGHYGSEWGGNFNIGTGVNHEGFLMAAQQVLEGLKMVVGDLGTDKPIRVMISGYSRAAATANLLAALLDDGAIEGITKENVFGFCFECPRNTTIEDAFSEKYSNIISVSNPNDLVPKTAESVFGYRRFGKTYYLPSPETEAGFESIYNKVKKTELTIIPFLFMPSVNSALVQFNFINDLAFAVKSKDYYVKHYQEAFMNASAIFLGGAKMEPQRSELYLINTVQQDIMALDPVNTLEIVKGVGSNPQNIFAMSFASPILQNHAMELTFSWLETLQSCEEFGPDKFQLLYFNNADEVIVEGPKGVVATAKGTIVDNTSDLFVNVNNAGEVVLLLPESTEYKATARGTDVSVSYDVFDLSIGLIRKIENYGPVSGEIKVTVNAQNNDSELSVDGKAVEPNQILKGDEVEYFKVIPKCNKDHRVTGGGYATVGKFMKLEVKDLDGFEGWFVDGEKVCSDPIYKFKAVEEVEVEARYS